MANEFFYNSPSICPRAGVPGLPSLAGGRSLVRETFRFPSAPVKILCAVPAFGELDEVEELRKASLVEYDVVDKSNHK